MTASDLVRPFTGLRPPPARAADVAAPPYDVLSDDEARVLAASKPLSFLHISKPVIDLPPGTDPYSAPVYRRARENLDRLRAEGVLLRDPTPCFYAYRLTMGHHQQTGLVAAASVDAYRAGRIKRHELTQPRKEDDRVMQIDVLDAQTGPVIAIHHPHEDLRTLLAAVTSEEAPQADVRLSDGVRHELWPITSRQRQSAISACFGADPRQIQTLYIADGHHRSAAAERVATLRQQRNPSHTGTEAYNYFLAVAFPTDQMQVLDYNRLIRDLAGRTAGDFLQALQHDWFVEASADAVRPAQPDQFGLYLEGRWYRLRLRHDRHATTDPVSRLAVSLLHDFLIDPVLGIKDERRDPRIDFVGGIRGLGELQRRVDSGEMALAFSLCATSVSELIAVADDDKIMPPKSTWFEPKLADGLVSHWIGSED